MECHIVILSLETHVKYKLLSIKRTFAIIQKKQN